jgi:hypothetical protein
MKLYKPSAGTHKISFGKGPRVGGLKLYTARLGKLSGWKFKK